MIVEEVRKYLLTCPVLSDKKINVNCLGTKMRSFTIDNVPCDSVIKKYCDGSVLKQAKFALGVRDVYDENLKENLYVSGLLEQVETWIFNQNTLKNLPELLQDGLYSRSIEVTKSGYLDDTSMGSGRWQMEFRVVYRQNAIM